jgi:hypothetical protein
MRRREFIAGLGGAAAWPLVARAQSREPMRRIGILSPLAENDPEGQARVSAFVQALQQLGWISGKNVLIDYRWANNNPDTRRRYAAEMIALAPDVILTHSSPVVSALMEANRAVPIVFALVADPVAAGYVESLARPGGNITGFTAYDYSTSGKWLELLKEVAPRLGRVAVLREAAGRNRSRNVQRHPGAGAIDWRGGTPHRSARCWRDRTRCDGFCAELRCWTDCNQQPRVNEPARLDHCARGKASPARSLQLSLLG